MLGWFIAVGALCAFVRLLLAQDWRSLNSLCGKLPWQSFAIAASSGNFCAHRGRLVGVKVGWGKLNGGGCPWFENC